MFKYLSNFETYLNTVKKASKNTLESYLRDIRMFSEYCSDNKISSPSKVKPEFVTQYLNVLEKMGKSSATVSRNAASLKCYFAYLESEGLVKKSPVVTVKVNRGEKKLPEILTSNEVKILLEQPNVTELKGCRDKAMLELLYATGIKVSELVALRLYDFNPSIGVLHLKDSKNERIIPLYPEAVKAVINYISNVRNVVVLDEAVNVLFTNMNGMPMTRQGFWKIIKQYAESANIKKAITPHTLRHSLAAHLLENGAPLKDIKDILGHSDISSTQIYAQMMRKKYAQSYKKYHPLAR